MSDATKTQDRLVIRRTIMAPRQTVFDAWTKPEHLKNWWRAKPTMTTEIADVDLRVGGKYRLGMRAPDAPEPFVCFGTFLEVTPPAKLVYTWSWEPPGMDVGETLVTVEFIDSGTSTELVLTHERFPTTDAAAKHDHGWTACLDMLVSVLNSN